KSHQYLLDISPSLPYLLTIMMSVSSLVRRDVETLSPGSLLRQADLSIPAGKEMAVAQALSRLVKRGVLERIEKGLYYKPKQSRFGSLRPDTNQLLRELIRKNKGYITDTAAYNSIGITTQLPRTIVIASGGYAPPRTVAGLTVRYRRSKVKANTASPAVLQLLDALRSIKRIPDATPDQVISRVIDVIRTLSPAEKKELVACAAQYNPSVRSLVAAILEYNFSDIDISILASSLNPLSTYKIEISSAVLPNKAKWSIK
ncbi:MAG: DUF6088 family protein, partial [Spirochaetota bacterium]